MRVLAALTPLLLSGCVTMLSPSQRQQLETKLYAASYERAFAASRDALINLNFAIDQSDYAGGVITVSREILAKNPAKAAGLSLLCPLGDFYMGRFAWGLFDTLTWPYCILWSAPANYMLASEQTKRMRGTLSLERLGPDRTRLRVTSRACRRTSGATRSRSAACRRRSTASSSCTVATPSAQPSCRRLLKPPSDSSRTSRSPESRMLDRATAR